jgi:hypothetical protein
MASENKPDWQTLFRQRRELTRVRDKALQELHITNSRRTENELNEAIERAEQACNAVATFDTAHPQMVGEDEQYENAQVWESMARFTYR